jgi:transglutaminase-like putative cysteine protease
MTLLFTEVPNWVIFTSLGFLGLSLIRPIKSLKYIKWLTGIASVVVVIIALREFSFVLSNELIASLLIILTSIRLIEHSSAVKEPPYFLFLLGLFLAVVKFVFQIDFIFGVYAFLATVFYLYQFFPENFRKNHTSESFRVLRSIVAYSVPVTALLFLLFPQFKFDGSRQRNYGLFSTIGASGFSAELRPGSISELVKNENIAFRAEFNEFVPEQNKLYWRGQVLDRPQGLMWRRSNPLNHTQDIPEEDLAIYQPSYKIILEPHFKEQLFTLYETTSVASSDKLLLSEKNNTYSLPSSLTDRFIYNGYVELNKKEKINTDRDEYLHLNRRSARVEELLTSLVLANGVPQTAAEKVKLIAKNFTESKFEYRLSGQELAVNSLDEFLFKTKVGFCEHYASAAALLLRYWNVPSRVVVGYQGGEINRAGNFWTVKQKDAHAWVEYLNEKNIWVLFDPVDAIAPDRIAMGAEYFLNPTGSGQLLKQLGKQFEIFDRISNLAEIYNYRWTLFFVEYSSANLKRDILKFYEANEDVQIVARLILLLICIYIVYALIKRIVFPGRPLSERYHRELHRFFSKKLPQRKNETFVDWKLRLESKYPHSRLAIEHIFSIYLKNRYGLSADEPEFFKFKKLLKSTDFIESKEPSQWR